MLILDSTNLEMKRPSDTSNLLPFRGRNWGGKRKGAGRRPDGVTAGVSHRCSTPLAARFPVHVTTKLKVGLPSLRSKGVYAPYAPRSPRAASDMAFVSCTTRCRETTCT